MEEDIDINDMGLDPSGNAHGTKSSPSPMDQIINSSLEAGGYKPGASSATDHPPIAGESQVMIFLLFILVLSAFLGFELISRVPSTLHTPLMSGSNAISGITIVGAILALHSDQGTFGIVLGTCAVAFATINVVGGYLVTDRMLGMFRKKEGAK